MSSVKNLRIELMPFKIEISLTDFYDVRLHGQVWVENESKVPGRIREGDVSSGRETVEDFNENEKGKRGSSFCFVVVQFELTFSHPCFYVVCVCTEFFGEVCSLR